MSLLSRSFALAVLLGFAPAAFAQPGPWKIHKDLGKEKVFRAKGRAIIILKEGGRGRMGKQGLASRKVRGSRALALNVEAASFNEDEVSFETLRAELKANPDVAGVEPDLRLRTAGPGDGFLKAADNDFTHVQHPRWRLGRPGKKPARKARVGILDTGLDFLHPDLANVAERGVNLIYSTPELPLPDDEASDSTEMDYNGHGTEVAGIIAAERNAIGIDGLADAKVIGIKAFNQEGDGLLSDAIAGIQWAMDHKIDVLNMSCGTYENSQALQDIVAKAIASGMIIVAAAGNDHAGEAAYPARLPGVLSVGSLDENDQISAFSNFGPTVGFFAPGEKILTTALRGTADPYLPFNGTSAACAHVSGLIAEGISEGATASAAVAMLRKTAEKRLEFLAPGDPDFSAVHGNGFLSSLRKESVGRLTLAGLGSDRVYWKTGEKVKLRYRIQNTGTTPLPKTELNLRVSIDEEASISPAGSLPSLRPGETYDGSVTLPADLSREPLEAEISLSPAAPGPAQTEGFDANWHLTVFGKDQDRLFASSFWVSDLEAGKNPGRKLIIKVMNIGNTATPALDVLPKWQMGGHCELGRGEQFAAGSGAALGSLKPGESRMLELGVPDLDIPTAHSFTLMAYFTKGADLYYRPKKQMRAVQKGHLSLFYSQEVHRWIASEAVKLLAKQGVYIPDLMSPTHPYLGGTKPYLDINDKIGEFINPTQTTWWSNPSANLPGTYFTLVNGAHDGDETDINFHYTVADLFDTHFWNVDVDDHQGHTYGTGNAHHHSTLDRIRSLMYGNKVVTDSKLINGAIDHYKQGYKSAAWYFMGHVMHMIGDLSVPSHIDDANWHGVYGDGYHDWMDAGNYSKFGNADIALAKHGGFINPYIQPEAAGDPVRFLAYTTAQVGGSYSYGNRDINVLHVDYEKDGNRTAGGETPHYDNYMSGVYAKMQTLNQEIGIPLIHPVNYNHIVETETLSSDNVCSWSKGICLFAPCFDVARDCWDGNGHIERNNSFNVESNLDRDLEGIARNNINYAIRAAAGMIYVFAVETKQVRFPWLPTVIRQVQP